MTSVLLLQQSIPHYRVPIFNLLAARCALTVVYSEGVAPENAAFTALRIPRVKIPRVGLPYRANLRRLAKRFDVVIGSFDSDPLTRIQLEHKPRRWKLIYWGIGVSASYTAHYDADRAYDAFFRRMVDASDASLFYADYPKQKYARLGVPADKLFVAPNTVAVPAVPEGAEKDSVLFIGSLYRQKGLGALLSAYASACGRDAAVPERDVPKLVLIGDGGERAALERRAAESDLAGRVSFAGAIYDDAQLAPYFARALACVSPGQAGLSVLKAMGCGVPYITNRNAITGGEIFNIESGVNGLLYDTQEELTEIFCDMAKDPARFLALGRAAKAHYDALRRPEQMAQGFLNAVDFVLADS